MTIICDYIINDANPLISNTSKLFGGSFFLLQGFLGVFCFLFFFLLLIGFNPNDLFNVEI